MGERKGGGGSSRGRASRERRAQRAQRERHAPREQRAWREPQELDESCGLPVHLVSAVRGAYGEDGLAFVTRGWQEGRERPVTLRANVLRATADDVASALDAAGVRFSRVSWYADAFVLAGAARERDVWGLPAYEQGNLYLQSLSSMLPPLVLAPKDGADVLDMCAAPGGKTSQMAAMAKGGEGTRAAHVTACELSSVRADKLEHNLAKLGATNVQVMRCDARELDPWFRFDQILVDAPCTGSGTVCAHDERAARNLTPELARRVERSQRALLDRALEVLKPGGELVYSTCSIVPRENEDVVEWALGRHADCRLEAFPLPWAQAGETSAASSSGGACVPTLLPCRLPGAFVVCPSRLFEGFFVARIKKRG